MPILLNTPYRDYPRVEMLEYVPLSAMTILDVGCHTGVFGRALKERNNVEVWGIEPNPDTAKVAEQHLDKVFNAYFSKDLDLSDHSFDVIIFNDVLEHMPDPWAALRLAASKLKPNGSVVISIPNLRHIDNLVHIIRERDFNYEETGIRDKTHLRFFTRKSAVRLFDNTGLKIVNIQGINESVFPSFFRNLAFRLFKNYFDDTRHIQFAIVAKPASSTA